MTQQCVKDQKVMTSAIQSFEAQMTLNLKIMRSRCPKICIKPTESLHVEETTFPKVEEVKRTISKQIEEKSKSKPLVFPYGYRVLVNYLINIYFVFVKFLFK